MTTKNKMIKKIISTNKNNWVGLIARLAIAIAVFPHGAQKLLGWFGGNGFEDTMTFMSERIGLPNWLGFLVIVIEFFAPLLLVLGLHTRLVACLILINFIGVLSVDTIGNGFFMNWAGVEGKGEGLEYFILLFSLLFIVLIKGGQKLSVDAAWSQ